MQEHSVLSNGYLSIWDSLSSQEGIEPPNTAFSSGSPQPCWWRGVWLPCSEPLRSAVLVAAPRLFLPTLGSQGSYCNFRHHLQITKFKYPFHVSEWRRGLQNSSLFLPWPEMLVKAYSQTHQGYLLGYGYPGSSLYLLLLPGSSAPPPPLRYTLGKGRGVLCVPPTTHRYTRNHRDSWGTQEKMHMRGHFIL